MVGPNTDMSKVKKEPGMDHDRDMKDDRKRGHSGGAHGHPIHAHGGGHGGHGGRKRDDRDSHRGERKSYMGSNDRRGESKSKDEEVKTEESQQPPEPPAEKKFTGRCRLFIGNLPNDIKEDEFKKMFEPYGETSEVFINPSRGFGFARLVIIYLLMLIIFPIHGIR